MTIRQIMTRRRITALSLVLLAGIATAIGAGYREATGETDQRPESVPVQVRVEPARQVDSFASTRTYTGTIEARRASEIGFERAAKIVEMLVDQGDHVVQGQPLARLDTRQLLARRRRIEAERDQAAAVMAELEAGPRQETIEAARAEMRDLESQVELQRRDFARISELLRQNAASKERSDRAELGLRSAEARLAVARKQLDELLAGTRSEQITAQRAAVAQLDAQLADIDIDIVDSTLLAPFAGRIADRMVDDGTVVKPAQPVYRIVESDELEAHIGLPAKVWSVMDREQHFEVVVEGESWRADLVRVLPEVDLQTRTRTAIFQLASDAAGRVVPGQVARITVRELQPTDGYWLPTTALVRGFRGLWAAYVVEPDRDGSATVQRRDVEVLYTEADRTLVRGTLLPQELVITSGTHRVVPGQKVVTE